MSKNISLAKYTTFKIGGPAKYFLIAKTKKELTKAIKTAKENKLPFFILGGGSNVLVSDKGFNGLVIKIQSSKSKLFQIKPKAQNPKIWIESGAKLGNLIKSLVENNLTGLEWVAGIPGTIGGAIRGNAGVPEKSMKDIVKNVEVLDADTLKQKIFTNKDCKFKYRDSIFKRNKNLIILSAEIELKKNDSKKSKQIIKEILKDRAEKIPKGYSAGSIFKNPENISAGELIEICGFKGFAIGGAQVSFQHANFIINFTGNAKAEDVINLINLIKNVVKDKTGIKLEEEIQCIGF
ncbi:UDP-N-acetylmuramate dehydrogenase [Candidatus Parcubacteria bacterium]|nr:UDP-N-acetylmuramate dehydrogenase [Candidatus Parcubacteria bacterium]